MASKSFGVAFCMALILVQSVSTYEISKKQESEKVKALFESQEGVKQAFEGVVQEVEGFEQNAQEFQRRLMRVADDLMAHYVATMTPLLREVPAETVKEFIINSLKTIEKALRQIGPIVKEYNPLHPAESLDLRALIRRQLTTLSTFGGAVEHLIDALDDLAVNYVDMLAVSIDASADKIAATISMLEHMPAEQIKAMATMKGG